MEFNKKYNRSEFLEFLENKFLPEDFVKESTVLSLVHNHDLIKSVTKLGTCETLDIVVYEIIHNSKTNARVSLSKAAFRLLANEWQKKALVLFVPEDDKSNYRFSLITIDLIEKPNGNTKFVYSNPRRYSYFLGEGISYYTPNKYLNKLGRITDEKDLLLRFSTEVLTKEFYQELSDWYHWSIDNVKFPNRLYDNNDDKKFNAEAMIRLATRLIFVWFLKQKNLIPEEFFDEDYIANNLLIDFNPHKTEGLFGEKSYETKYYKAIIQNLFFAMLNCPIYDECSYSHSIRRFASEQESDDNYKLMRYKSLFKNPELFLELANKCVPFLNGGLFECLDDKKNNNYIDAFSDKEIIKRKLSVPDFLFFGDEMGKEVDLSGWYGGDKKKKKVHTRGIIDILKKYNFTVEENTPFDQEVSLDPELLGKVFENLLASFNPETQTTARKQTGSFYTPRDVVQHMVDESLIEFLKNSIGENLDTELRKLVSYSDEDIRLSTEEKQNIIESLYHCKVLDPACGSGAFPMGILQQMVHILSKLDPNNIQWEKIVTEEAVNSAKNALNLESKDECYEHLKDIKAAFDDNLNDPDYARKLYLIENCIYGIDIQPIAIQISKLRFFISLVVDQKNHSDSTKNFGIRPLPNLEAKFVCANTLVPLEHSKENLGLTPKVLNIEKELKEANHKIFNARTNRTKNKWRDKINLLQIDLKNELVYNGFFNNSDAELVSSWDRFDQNASAKFYDSFWMFGTTDGFDIVIANPPYLKERDNKKYFEPVLKTAWGKKYHTGKMDFWFYFLHKAIELAKKESVICFITSRYWIKSLGAKKLISHISKETDFLSIIDFGKLKVFDCVAGLHMISLFKKEKKSQVCTYKKIIDDVSNLRNGIFEENRLIKQDELITPNMEINLETPRISFNVEIQPLKNFFSVSQGVVEAPAKLSSKMYHKYPSSKFHKGDGIFVLTDSEVDAINLSLFEREECLVNYLTDGAINKYKIDYLNLQNLIYSDKNIKEKIQINKDHKYENIKEHLDRCSPYITSSNFPYGLHRPRTKEAFMQNKILGPSMFKHPSFAIDTRKCFVGMSYLVVNQLSNLYSIYALLGILNSNYADCWFWQNAKHRGIGVDVGVAKLQEFSLPSAPNKDILRSIETLVIKICKEENFESKFDEDLKQIDQLVYQLYELSPTEIHTINSDINVK